jgi:hypothetical protein
MEDMENLSRAELKTLTEALDLLRNQMRQDVEDGWTDQVEYRDLVQLQNKLADHLAALPY